MYESKCYLFLSIYLVVHKPVSIYMYENMFLSIFIDLASSPWGHKELDTTEVP